MELLELKCRNCGSALSSPEITANLQIVRCSHCDAIYALDDKGSQPEPDETATPKPRVKLPRGFVMTDDGRELVISRRRLSELTFVALAVGLLWIGVSIFAWTRFSEHGPYWYVNLLVFLPLAYYIVVGFVNRWVLRASRDLLTLRDEPLPWASGLAVNIRNVTQFFVTERLIKNAAGDTFRRYSVHAIDASGKTGRVLEDLTTIEQAFFVEQELERYLGITDKLVDGEVGEAPREEA